MEKIEEKYRNLEGSVRMGLGWGKKIKNDFEGCEKKRIDGIKEIYLV